MAIVHPYRNRVKGQLMMCNEERHSLFEDIGTQVNIIEYQQFILLVIMVGGAPWQLHSS